MKNAIFIGLFSFLLSISYSQNISIDKSKHQIIGIGATGDTNVYLCESKLKKKSIYALFYKRDSVIWPGKSFFHKEDFDSITNRIYTKGILAPVTGFLLKNKAKIKLNKEFVVKVGMMPTFGWYVGKKKPGRYKQIGYHVKIESEDSLSYDGYVYYYFQKQSLFKRFFKRHRIKKRFKKLPIILGIGGREVIFKNDMIEEGGQVRAIYYSFKLKEEKK
jgi:hypothetical protein